MDRGFDSMIPQAKEEEPEQKSFYDYNINFNLFGKRFSFIIKVDNTRRTK